MSEKKVNELERLYEYYKRDLGHVYTAEEFGEKWGGPKYPKPFVGFNRWATPDTITHFVDGIGDLNPLYRDENYAKKTKYGCLIAPPCFLYSVWWAGTAIDLVHGVHGWYSGSEWEWFRPICEGDKINWKTIQPADVQFKTSAMAKKTLIIYSEDEFTRQGGEVIAIHKAWVIHGERSEAVQKAKYAAIAKTHEYSVEDIKKIHASQEREGIWGAAPRYWEDVAPGEELTPIVFGPLTMNEMLVWLIGGGNLMNKSDRIWRILYDQHPDGDLGFFDPGIKIKLNLELPHLDNGLARQVGAPGAYDFGSQRISCLGMLLTNWMGDDGFLWKFRAELRRFNIIGDTTWCKGKVVRKYMDGGKCCVDIECWGENQRGEMTIPGTATIILPSREHGSVTYPLPRHIIKG